MAPNISARPVWATLTLLWLAGSGLRLTLLAVPPVLPLIHADLNLSEVQVGALGSLPTLLLALAAIPGSLLIARFGVKTALVVGLLMVGLGSAARGGATGIASLYLATIVTAAGVAVMQPAMPPAVRAWIPERIPLATAVYTNGLLVAEVLAVALTLPVILPMVDGSWRLAFVVWGVPVLAIAAIIAIFAPGAPKIRVPQRWWPNWRDPLIWRLGFCLGCVNTCYFATNTFLPDYLHAMGRGDLVSGALTSLNLGQLPASFLMLAIAPRVVLKRWAYACVGLGNLACIAGIVLMPGDAVLIWSGLLGFSVAAGLILVLALAPLLGDPDDVHRLSAAIFTISYPCAVLMSVIGGYAWDVTGLSWTAFMPIGFCAIVLAGLPFTIDFGRARR